MKKEVSRASAESPLVESLPLPMAVCRRGLPFIGPLEKDSSLCGRSKVMPVGRRRSRAGVELRPVSGIRGEGGRVLLMGTEASRAPVLVLEVVECGR